MYWPYFLPTHRSETILKSLKLFVEIPGLSEILFSARKLSRIKPYWKGDQNGHIANLPGISP
jgi:hypothetical protein